MQTETIQHLKDNLSKPLVTETDTTLVFHVGRSCTNELFPELHALSLSRHEVDYPTIRSDDGRQRWPMQSR